MNCELTATLCCKKYRSETRGAFYFEFILRGFCWNTVEHLTVHSPATCLYRHFNGFFKIISQPRPKNFHARADAPWKRLVTFFWIFHTFFNRIIHILHKSKRTFITCAVGMNVALYHRELRIEKWSRKVVRFSWNWICSRKIEFKVIIGLMMECNNVAYNAETKKTLTNWRSKLEKSSNFFIISQKVEGFESSLSCI